MANIEIDIRSELPKVQRWTNQMTKQLPFAVSRALNDTAFDVRTALNGATRQYFDKPVPFTQRAFMVTRSTKRELSAKVYAERRRDRYLRTLVHGGDRGQKGFERRFLGELVGTRNIPANSQLIPTSLVRLNAAGNVSLATIRNIQRGLNTNNKRGGFFVGVPKGGNRPAGIYRRSRLKLHPYFVAIDQAATYRPQFPMAEIGQKVAQRRFGAYLRSSLEKALATAR